MNIFWISIFFLVLAPAPAADSGHRVIPLALEQDFSGEEAWVEVHYLASPRGEDLFFEPGERIWTLQGRSFVMLGGSGQPLPGVVTERSSVFVVLETSQAQIGPVEIHPRKQALWVEEDPGSLMKALPFVLPGVDASYLVQVAQYLSGNLAALNVQGTSYSVSGFGPVIDAEGAWVGGRLAVQDGTDSVFVGQGAGISNQNGTNNVGLGKSALEANQSGAFNVAIGSGTLQNNTGSGNVGVGGSALLANVTGQYNSALGHSALADNQSGVQNTAVGSYAMDANSSGNYNTAVGAGALESNGEGDFNAGFGYLCLRDNVASNNAGFGTYALRFTTTGTNNAAFGNYALRLNDAGSSNAALGINALRFNTTGGSNTAVGYYAGGASSSTGGFNNTVALGAVATVTASNQVRLGNAFSTSIGGYTAWSNLSDGRFKDQVTENVPGLDFIMALRPVTFRMNATKLNQFLGLDARSMEGLSQSEPTAVQSGFVAQEVELAAKNLGFDFSGIEPPANAQTPYALRYAEFVVPMTKAIQEQQALLEMQSRQIQQLQSELRALAAALARIQP